MGDWDRREFLQKSAWLGLGGLAIVPSCGDDPGAHRAAMPAASGRVPEIRRRSTLGRSGIEIPDISFGGWGLNGQEQLVRHALAHLVFFLDGGVGGTAAHRKVVAADYDRAAV